MSGSYVAQIVTEAWSYVLDIPHPKPQDEFFMQGGDSLHAVEFVTIVEDRLQVEVPLIILFGDGSLAGMIEACEEAFRSSQGTG